MDLVTLGHKSLFMPIAARHSEPVHGERLAHMNENIDERRYAWRMIHAARQAQSTEVQVNGTPVARDDIAELLDLALDAGLDRAQIIIQLADLGARFFTLCTPAPMGTTTAVIEPDISSNKAVSV